MREIYKVEDLKNPLHPQETYILAVSGGVDSVVLLDWLKTKASKSQLVVAHLDPGMRPESDKDATFVQCLAEGYGLDFVADRVNLGDSASEADARDQRYDFLFKTMHRHQAQAVVTAHHMDDFIETAILNFKRGSKRRGLVSLQSRPDLLRPMLSVGRKTIIDYATKHKLEWVEDASNYNIKYLRNFVRHKIMPKITNDQRLAFINASSALLQANHHLDNFLKSYLSICSHRREGKVFSRAWFQALDDEQSREVVARWLKEGKISITSALINYVVVKLKTLPPGKIIVVSSKQQIRLTKRCLRLEL